MNTAAKASILSIFFICAGIIATAQKLVDKQYDFRNFSELDIGGAYTVEVSQGSNYKVTLTYPENLEDRIKCRVNGDELELGLKGGSRVDGYPKALIQMPALKAVDLHGASSTTLNEFKGEEIEIEISGASSLNGKLTYNKLELKASGASNTKIQGSIIDAKIYLSGASSFGNQGFNVTGEFIFDGSGASKAEMTVDGDMYVKLSGASSLDYYGQGTLLKPETSGASDITKLDK